jgi:hypothetical protein
MPRFSAHAQKEDKVKNRLAVALGALVLMVAVTAVADYNVLDKTTYKQNATSGQRVNNTGDLRVDDVSRDRDNWVVTSLFDDTTSVADLIDTKSTAGQPYTAESSAVIPCGQYRRFTLCLRVVPAAGDTTSRFRYAVQIRKHSAAAADSASTFAWQSWGLLAPGATAPDDSTGHFGAAVFWQGTGTATGASAWSNERVFVFDSERGQSAASGSVGQSFGWPGGYAIDLQDTRGQSFWAPYISVRIRCLSNGRTTINKARIIGTLMMGS